MLFYTGVEGIYLRLSSKGIVRESKSRTSPGVPTPPSPITACCSLELTIFASNISGVNLSTTEPSCPSHWLLVYLSSTLKGKPLKKSKVATPGLEPATFGTKVRNLSSRPPLDMGVGDVDLYSLVRCSAQQQRANTAKVTNSSRASQVTISPSIVV